MNFPPLKKEKQKLH